MTMRVYAVGKREMESIKISEVSRNSSGAHEFLRVMKKHNRVVRCKSFATVDYDDSIMVAIYYDVFIVMESKGKWVFAEYEREDTGSVEEGNLLFNLVDIRSFENEIDAVDHFDRRVTSMEKCYFFKESSDRSDIVDLVTEDQMMDKMVARFKADEKTKELHDAINAGKWIKVGKNGKCYVE